MIVHGPNQLFTVRNCSDIECKVKFSANVSRADKTSIGLWFFNDQGEKIAAVEKEISGATGETKIEVVAPRLTKKVRAWFYSPPSGSVEFTDAALIIELSLTRQQ